MSKTLVNKTRSVWLSNAKVTKENCTKFKNGKVIYWMWREQRVEDNWALLRAQEIAKMCGSYVSVLFVVVPKYIEYSARHYSFMLNGLKEVDEGLRKKRIPFQVEVSMDPVTTVKNMISQEKGTVLVTDFTPLRENMAWTKDLSHALDDISVPFCQVDAHNIVPYNVTSNKCEYAARTIRKKIMSRLDDYLDDFPEVETQSIGVDPKKLEKTFDYESIWKLLLQNGMDTSIEVVDSSYFVPGTKAGLRNLKDFCSNKFRLQRFGSHRNDPTHRRVLSGMSPYFHFGQVAPQRAIMEAKEVYKANKNAILKDGLDSFVEEAVVRRELSDNFCFYNPNYDNLKGAYKWAQDTLKVHNKDKREYIYSFEEFENGNTHDELWNAAQLQLKYEGKLHGFLRMYWAKKILEWTPKAKVGLSTAQKLNDRYALDGNDPNGFVGVGWSIMGIHDQGWREREVFGKIRYMNFAGCKRKFDVQGFIDDSMARYKNGKAKKYEVSKPGSKFDRKKTPSKFDRVPTKPKGRDKKKRRHN
mmetsp:Transcript_14929/g.16886  ORF Transcript_14929/g.16886 Transcript_14929/m.16886 type:complete len:527 (-) Transcript_14929:227-1807(-)|eukprot:CAMPEP_0184022870 /NCGR_PEP_ID=MMETSP0954-20121128/10930_1 /TAXON_ID=627963 /ORGANISM="Aplanochytrium sp, Strain PBS07" /LENGTH=526 /DNA_ID=CAMNT_0026305461 /DNA_START=96 /DNA_END=1676 /DNA_ORIENTATION=+